MNERIEELKKQAMIRVNNPTVNSNGKVICDNWEEGISLSKFAELIVRECARVVSEKTGPKSALDVLEHFGI